MHAIRRLFNNSSLLRIVATNIREGDSLGLHPDSIVDAVTSKVQKNLQERFPHEQPTAKDYLVELETVCFGDVPHRSGSEHLLKGVPQLEGGGPDWYTTIVTVDFWLRCIAPETLEELGRRTRVPLPFLPMGGGSDTALIKALEFHPKGEFVPRDDFVLGYPLVWLTPRPAIDAHLDANEHPAEFVRDHLGLIHRGAGHHLMAMHLPASAIDLVASARPTFADAGIHRRFIVTTEDQPPPYHVAWGQTLDLKRFEEDRQLASGGAERVSARIKIEHLSGKRIPFHFLGRVRETRGLARASDDDFAARKIARDEVGYNEFVQRL